MENLNKTYEMMDSLLKEVKEFVKGKGGFINTTNLNKENDQIYAYIYCGEYYSVDEVKVIAIKVENNLLHIATCVQLLNVEINGIEDFAEDDWYVVDKCSWDVLFSQTILSIAESIEQYK